MDQIRLARYELKHGDYETALFRFYIEGSVLVETSLARATHVTIGRTVDFGPGQKKEFHPSLIGELDRVDLSFRGGEVQTYRLYFTKIWKDVALVGKLNWDWEDSTAGKSYLADGKLVNHRADLQALGVPVCREPWHGEWMHFDSKEILEQLAKRHGVKPRDIHIRLSLTD
ncbi:hypothetical protein [Pseudomonas sp. 1928-m]|uniref:hypothetical protein n=1 Tax=Pseudomonas sp. 1928-m TaxID=3033804 RepID=UPI0023DF41BF|nr:hypothetical protein [Pseudomonas sp. 1928-m]MDF3195688.1 hypothetical protein [Pseudomonas sp. 1928-m]